MRPQFLMHVGGVCLVVCILGFALSATLLATSEPTIWDPFLTAASYMLGVVGAGLLTIGLAFRGVDVPAPVRHD